MNEIQCDTVGFSCRSVSQRLTEKKERAERELKKINEAIEVLQKNPELVIVIDALNGSF